MNEDLSVFPHKQMPGSLELAFVGDSVYDLYVRSNLVKAAKGKVNALSRSAVDIVNAKAQAESLERLYDVLTDEEKIIARRAQNTKQTPTKHAEPYDYCRATALEAVLGYLYLTGKLSRLNELLKLSTGMEGDFNAI